jgi:hypothetical protein
MVENLSAKEPISDAASKLGKRGAEVRKAKPIPDKDADGDGDANVGDGADESPATERLDKPVRSARERMLDATRKEAHAKRERDAAKAEAAALRAERDALRAQPQATRQAPAEVAPTNGAKPKPESYETYEDWVEALADYKADQKVKGFREESAQAEKLRSYRETLEHTLADATSVMKEYEKADPGWFARISEDVKDLRLKLSPAKLPDEPIQPDHVIADAILLSGATGPRILLHFTDHPDELDRIRALPTWQETQIEMRVLAKMLGSVGVATTGTTPTKSEGSKARPPVRPVTGSPHTAETEPGQDASYEEHRRYWNAKEKRAR